MHVQKSLQNITETASFYKACKKKTYTYQNMSKHSTFDNDKSITIEI